MRLLASKVNIFFMWRKKNKEEANALRPTYLFKHFVDFDGKMFEISKENETAEREKEASDSLRLNKR